MRHKMASITQRLRLPTVCALCKQNHRGLFAICDDCHHLLEPIGAACHHCAHPLPTSDFLMCGYCSKKRPYVDQTIAACRFVEPLRSLLHEFKYHEGLYLCSFLTKLILEALPAGAEKTQCLIPVPMHRNRLHQRGFNQAAELAKQLGKALHRPYDLIRCKKIINTLPQASLNAEQRQSNLRGAFQAAPIPYEHVTLVDDLITTGNTVNELAKLLKSQGIKRVDVWCCAKAVALS